MTSNKVNWPDMNLNSHIFQRSVYPGAVCRLNIHTKKYKRYRVEFLQVGPGEGYLGQDCKSMSYTAASMDMS